MVNFFLFCGSRAASLSIPDVNEGRGDRQDETNHETAQEAAAAELVHVHTPGIGARARVAARREPMTPRRLRIIAANRRFIQRLWRAAGSWSFRSGSHRKDPKLLCIVTPFEAKSAAAFAESALMGQIKEGGDSRKRHRENSEQASKLDEIAHVLTLLHRSLL